MRVGTWKLGSLSGNGGEVCDELRKRMNDVCCSLEVRWRGLGARMLGIKGRRYNLWWSGKRDRVGGVGVIPLGLQHVCKLWLEVSKDILPVKHLAPKIVAVNYCGCQLAQRLG